MKLFTVKPLFLAIAAVAAGSAVAQEPTTAPSLEGIISEEIVITGSFRDSLANALNVKRSSTGTVDVIMADDIASFPDLNLAESLQRIPGVAITRSAGEGRNISVRGLGSDFTRVRINGMESVATGGGTDAIGGTNRGRGFDFNTFSSELFSSLAVHKTASANLEEGSLGATVDMQSVRPFDFGDFTFSATGQLGYNDRAEEINPRASFLVSNVFAEGRLGALLSVSYSERDVRDEGSSTVRWSNAQTFASYQGDPNASELDDLNSAFAPRMPRYDSYNHNSERVGVAGSLQFLPTDRTEITLDTLYSKLDATRQEVFMIGLVSHGAASDAMNVRNAEIDNTNTITFLDVDNANSVTEHRIDELTTEFMQFTLNVDHEFSDTLRGNLLLGHARSEFDVPIQTTIVGEKSIDRFTYDYRGDRRRGPLLEFHGAAGDTSDWELASIRLRPQTVDNTYDAFQVDLEFDLNDSVTLKAGINYKNFEFATTGARRDSEGNVEDAQLEGYMMEYDSGLGNELWVIPDLRAMVADQGIHSGQGSFSVSPENRRAENYEVEEESFGIFAQLVFNTQLGNVPVWGDAGIRYVETDQTSSAWAELAGDPEYITAEHSYEDLLPSINLVLEPIEDVLVRLSYSEVMARAGLASIRPANTISVAGGSRTISGQNPNLEPTRAKSYDLAIELYFDDESMLSTALFHKNIESHVQTLRRTVPYTETGFPIQAAVAACEAADGYGSACNENLDWEFTQALNGPGGPLYGFEVSYQQPFTFLPGLWSQFGFIGNFTYVKAQMDYLDQDGQVLTTRDLLDLSENTSSGTVYWEDDRFGGRLSVVNRSGYLTNALGRDGNDREGVAATTNVDATFFYNLSDNLKLSFDALNLTDQADDMWVDASGDRLSYYHQTGRQFYIGAQYSF